MKWRAHTHTIGRDLFLPIKNSDRALLEKNNIYIYIFVTVLEEESDGRQRFKRGEYTDRCGGAKNPTRPPYAYKSSCMCVVLYTHTHVHTPSIYKCRSGNTVIVLFLLFFFPRRNNQKRRVRAFLSFGPNGFRAVRTNIIYDCATHNNTTQRHTRAYIKDLIREQPVD